jgi:acetyl esterase/lipase
MTNEQHINLKDNLAARSFQAVYPAMQRLFFRSPELEFATQEIADPTTIKVPTRHGEIDALVYAPTQKDIAAATAKGEKPPVHVITHGGAFIIQYPSEEGNVARYLASEVGCYVVVPDYLAAPQAQFPVAEDQCFDTFQWVHGATDQGWDTDRVTVGGPSAGGKLALTVALDAIEAGGYQPLAVTTEYGVADLSRGNEDRPSTKKRPVVGPQLMNLVQGTYYKGTDRHDPRVSPIFHPQLAEMPPTLVLTAEFDTLKHESNDLAAKLGQLGVAVTHHEYEGVDHGFTHQKPVETAKAAIDAIAGHIRTAYNK